MSRLELDTESLRRSLCPNTFEERHEFCQGIESVRQGHYLPKP